MNLDIGKAFTFVMEDQKWVAKLAIGGGLAIAWGPCLIHNRWVDSDWSYPYWLPCTTRAKCHYGIPHTAS